MLELGAFLEVLISGLLAGVLYSLVALGFVLIFKASGVFNFAQGAMVLLAGLALVRSLEFFVGKGVPWAGALALGLIFAALVMALTAFIALALFPVVAIPTGSGDALLPALNVLHYLHGSGRRHRTRAPHLECVRPRRQFEPVRVILRRSNVIAVDVDLCGSPGRDVQHQPTDSVAVTCDRGTRPGRPDRRAATVHRARHRHPGTRRWQPGKGIWHQRCDRVVMTGPAARPGRLGILGGSSRRRSDVRLRQSGGWQWQSNRGQRQPDRRQRKPGAGGLGGRRIGLNRLSAGQPNRAGECHQGKHDAGTCRGNPLHL